MRPRDVVKLLVELVRYGVASRRALTFGLLAVGAVVAVVVVVLAWVVPLALYPFA